MDLSVQNKNFLAVLNKIGIDIKQFPDKTFDGLFENVPESISYFFNWFIENITPDNVLTQSEKATYYQLESTNSLPSEEEMNYVLSSCNPGYEELMSLDFNYINNFLPQDLEDLKKYYEELSEVFNDVETSYNDIKKKQNILKEEINLKRKQLNVAKQECQEMNLLFGSKVDEVKTFLVEEPDFKLNVDIFNELIAEEEKIFEELKKSKSLKDVILNFPEVDYLPKLEEDLACVEMSAFLSEGFLKEKNAKIEFLTDLLQKEKSWKSFNDYILLNDEEEVDIKLVEEINFLESQVFEKKKRASHFEIQKIYNEYLSKLELNKLYLSKLTNCKDYMEAICKINSCLLDNIQKSIDHLEISDNLRQQLFLKLKEYENNFTSDITNLELRRQRFKEVSSNENQHPLLLALKDIMNVEENPEKIEEGLKNITGLISTANDDSNFISTKFRSDLQSSIKRVFDNTLYGPTHQLLFAPVELLIKLQECKGHERNLSQVIKQLASKYMNAKEKISKSDRKRLLLWIDFLTNPRLYSQKTKLDSLKMK